MEDPGGPADLFSAFFVIPAFILLGGFFSLVEEVLAGSRKTRLKNLAGEGNKKYLRALKALENPQRFFTAARIGVNLIRICTGVLGGLYITRIPAWKTAFLPGGTLAELGFVIAGITILFLAVLLLGEGLPRLISFSTPEKILAALLPCFNMLTLPLLPLIKLTARLSDLAHNFFHLDNPGLGMTEDELRIALAEGEKSGVVESKERTMVEGVFYLGDRPVGAFMTHRSEIEWLDLKASPEEIRAKALEHRSQRCYPVADGALDEIIGAAYLEDLILDQMDGSPRGLRGVMKKAQFVPETMPALKTFEAFKRGEADFLFVMDEYGGFAGLISLRDLVEEIVGELSSPAPEDAEEIVKQANGAWTASGSLNIDDAARAFSLESLAAEHQDYHTLAGFILSLAEEVPRPGAVFAYQGFRFRVLKMDGNRIDRVLISPPGELEGKP
ncbi:MAG: hemolysin family protein [Treponema sp.]|jgi:putative hemolysin|nr:hemolysin family protein [Treponema sp.]